MYIQYNILLNKTLLHHCMDISDDDNKSLLILANKCLIEEYDNNLLFLCKCKFKYKALNIIEANKVYTDQIEDIDTDKNTPLIWTCRNNMPEIAHKIISTYGEKCNPGQVNSFKRTALIYAVKNKMDSVAIELMIKFSNKCKIKQIDNAENNALAYACYNKLEDIANKIMKITNKPKIKVNCKDDNSDGNLFTAIYNDGLSDEDEEVVEEYNEWDDEYNEVDNYDLIPLLSVCKNGPESLAINIIDNNKNDTEFIHIAFEYVCKNNFKQCANKMIETFGDLCYSENLGIGSITELFWIIYNKMEVLFPKFKKFLLHFAIRHKLKNLAIKLIDTYGVKCVPGYIYDNSDTILIVACRNGLESIAHKLLITFGSACNFSNEDRKQKTFLTYAKEKNLVKVLNIMTLINIFRNDNSDELLDNNDNDITCVEKIEKLHNIFFSNTKSDAINIFYNGIKELIRNEKAGLKCCVCLSTMDSPVIFNPCKHICTCKSCSKTLTECPVCKSEIKVKDKVYF